MSGTLFVVATPIGNLGDITLRAIETLKSVDAILCEDTRVTAKLLARFSIQKPLVSYHQHSDAATAREIQCMLEEGKHLALVTDAGTPGISDPGNALVELLTSDFSNQQIIDRSLKSDSRSPASIVPIPGASAVTAALSVCGFPSDKFLFLGFPPHKNKRRKFFEEVARSEHTVVFYESGHRIKKSLNELAAALPRNRQVRVCRELTKVFESVYRGTMPDLAAMEIPEKGEFVIVVRGL